MPHAIAVISALVAHQVFRKFDTYCISLHAALLLGPPVAIVIYNRHLLSSTTETSILSCYAVYYLTLALSVVVYRLSPWHPLARHPGPFWYRTSSFCHAFMAITGRRNTYFKHLHALHGDVVRTGPNELSLCDPSVISTVMNLPKGSMFVGAFLGQNYPMVGIQDLEEHARRRRPWTRGLGAAALREYEHLTARRVRQLADTLEEQEKTSLDKWFDYFAYDVMSDMAFGGGSELMREGDKDGIWTILMKGTKAATFFANVPWLGIYVGKIPALVRPIQIFVAHGQKSAARRMARGSTTRDLFHYLNNEDLPSKSPPPLKHLVDDGILAVTAGSDTTASALTSIFFCLLTHPNTYASLQDEVDKFYPKGEDPLITKHHKDMVYMHAVINESLRFFPPITTNGSRQVPQHSNGVVAGPVFLPPGTTVYVPIFTLHRDARNFSFPDAFWPERWLVASGQLALDDAPLPLPVSSPSTAVPLVAHARDFALVHNEAAFIPFSAGPLNCVGRGLALQEIRMVVCALVQRFGFRLREDWDPREYERGYRDYFVSTRPDLPVVVEAR